MRFFRKNASTIRAKMFSAGALGLSAGLTSCGTMGVVSLDCRSPMTEIAREITPSYAFDSVSNDVLEKIAKNPGSDPHNLAAIRVLAERYEAGKNVGRDLTKSVALYRAAAFVPPKVVFVYMPGFGKVPGSVIAVGGGANIPGDPIAMRRLGEMYQVGLGVPADQFDARLLLECAATRGAASRPIAGPIVQ